jgi:hypothetical protein
MQQDQRDSFWSAGYLAYVRAQKRFLCPFGLPSVPGCPSFVRRPIVSVLLDSGTREEWRSTRAPLQGLAGYTGERPGPRGSSRKTPLKDRS